jgi:predicted glutamine amidotransferase
MEILMCRFLLVLAEQAIDPLPLIHHFAARCRESVENQGHGWGICWREDERLRSYRCLDPIWEDEPPRVASTPALLVHARSAFRDRDIVVDANMPFVSGARAFAFNGELEGVRLALPGLTGAARIFELIRRLDRGDPGHALGRAVNVLLHQTRRIRAMNMVLTDLRTAWLCSHFTEREDYYTVFRHREPGRLMVCSEPLTDHRGWRPVTNGWVGRLTC